jgi:hypothetical protein
LHPAQGLVEVAREAGSGRQSGQAEDVRHHGADLRKRETAAAWTLARARVRFLLADDAGAGKTIMAGLLIRELELRGLA